MTKKEQVYNYLTDWYCDENTANKLVNGFYEYGWGIEEVDMEQYNNDKDYKNYIDSQRENLLVDVDLPGSGYWLVGGMI